MLMLVSMLTIMMIIVTLTKRSGPESVEVG